MSLFERRNFIGHSGDQLDFKIECDDLDYDDLETLAYIISKKFTFCKVHGVPSGGNRLATALRRYEEPAELRHLLVDDILTTGASMEYYKKMELSDKPVIGVVLFARGKCPNWIVPLFQMWEE